MAMNIAKLQAQLQHVPDQSLIGYVQNPDGQEPSYLALAELTRRKEIRKAGPTSGQPQEKKPSIAQQAVQEAQPEAGVAGLQLPEDMYSEQTMAAGGIVAFEGGGDVKRYASQGFVLSDPMDSIMPFTGSGDFLARVKELKRANPWVSYDDAVRTVKAQSQCQSQGEGARCRCCRYQSHAAGN